MYKYIIDIIIFIFLMMIILRKDFHPLIWGVIGFYLFNFRIKFLGVIPIIYVLTGALILSMLLKDYKFIGIKKIPIRRSLKIFIIGIFIIGLFDFRLSLINKFIYPAKYLFGTVLLIYPAYYFSKRMYRDRIINIVFIFISLFITSYGVYEFATHLNPIKYFIESFFLDDLYLYETSLTRDITFGRFTGSSIFNFSYNFAFAASAIGLYALYVYKSKRKIIYILLSLMGIVACLLSSSRSSLIACLLAYSFFIVKSFNIKSISKLLLIIFPIVVLIISNVPILEHVFEGAVGIFKGESNFTGSSFEMRKDQFNAALLLFSDSPIIGNGLFYFRDVVGHGTINALDYGVYADLLGLEGYFMNVFLEQGVLGLIIAIFLYFSLFKYFKNSTNVDRTLSFLGISFLILFLIFSNATGTLASWQYSMFFIGLIMGQIELKKQLNCQI